MNSCLHVEGTYFTSVDHSVENVPYDLLNARLSKSILKYYILDKFVFTNRYMRVFPEKGQHLKWTFTLIIYYPIFHYQTISFPFEKLYPGVL